MQVGRIISPICMFKTIVKFLFSFLFFVILFFTIHSSVYAANTYYVAGDTGLDTNSGSIGSPWKTIQKAADTMVAGDTVNVKGGITYTGSTSCSFGNAVVCVTTTGTSGNPITYQSWAGTGIPVIDATGQSFGFAIFAANYINISGFEIKNANSGGTKGGIFDVLGTNSIFKNNLVHNIGGFGIYFNSATNTKIYNNTTYGNTISGIHFDGATSSTNEVKNNSITNNGIEGIGGVGSQTVVIDYNDVWNNRINYAYNPGAHDISSDPLFADGEFHLQSGSPAINSGTTLSDVPTDIVGVSRPQGAGYDIGAYEWLSIPLNVNYPSGYVKSNSTRPTLSFKKAIGSTNNMVSYSVTLDPGKQRSYSISGIPTSGNGTSNYVWRDDTDVKVVFLNEGDTDTSNDEIIVYFKGLTTNELTEGKHTWNLTGIDSLGNSFLKSTDFFLDRTSPSLTSLSLSNATSTFSTSLVQGKTYPLAITDRMPYFSGKVTDLYQGSDKTNDNGTKDTFDKVSSGAKSITLKVERLNTKTNIYLPYLNFTQDFKQGDIKDTALDKKEATFNIRTPYPLIDGYYQVTLTGKDKSDNTTTPTTFYLKLNYSGKTTTIQTTTTTTQTNPTATTTPSTTNTQNTQDSQTQIPSPTTTPIPTPQASSFNFFTLLQNIFSRIFGK